MPMVQPVPAAPPPSMGAAAAPCPPPLRRGFFAAFADTSWLSDAGGPVHRAHAAAPGDEASGGASKQATVRYPSQVLFLFLSWLEGINPENAAL